MPICLVSLFLLLSACVIFPGVAVAQSTVYVAYSDESACNPDNFLTCKVSRLMKATVGAPTSRIDWIRQVPRTIDLREAYVTPDGSRVVWLGISGATGPSVYVHDVATGSTATIGPFHGARILLGNPVHPEVYVFDSTGFTALSPNGQRRVDLPCLPGDRAAISADGRRLSVICGPSLGTAIVDTASGTLVAELSLYGKISADGDHVYTRDYVNGQFRLQRRSLATGDVLADVPNPGFELLIDHATGDVVTYGRGTYPSTFLMDGATLAQRWGAQVSIDIFGNSLEPVIDQATGYLYSASQGVDVDVLDTRSAQPVGLARFRASRGVAIATAPPVPAAPAGLSAIVAGGAVQLAWSASSVPAAVTRYLVEAGSGPGLGDIVTVDVGAQTALTVGGVPPGTYYVRVRAANASGRGAPSNEVVVTVP
jgi:hypothetical protein